MTVCKLALTPAPVALLMLISAKGFRRVLKQKSKLKPLHSTHSIRSLANRFTTSIEQHEDATSSWQIKAQRLVFDTLFIVAHHATETRTVPHLTLEAMPLCTISTADLVRPENVKSKALVTLFAGMATIFDASTFGQTSMFWPNSSSLLELLIPS